MQSPRPLRSALTAALLLSSNASLMADLAPPPLQRIEPGPWGEIEYYTLMLEPPDYYIQLSPDLKRRDHETVWKLDAEDAEAAYRILASSGLGEELARELTAPGHSRRDAETGVFEIRPGESTILGLSSEQRSRLYPHLLPRENSNPYHQPFALPANGINAVTGVTTGVPREQLDLITHLTYRRGEALRFSDITFVFGKARDKNERVRILKTLGREPTLSARLRMDPASNLPQLAEYWSSGGRNKEVLPLLTSVMETPGIETLDIVHLLPPVPRKHLFTFPSPYGEGMGEEMPDCFWTAFSFFSDTPPDRHFDYVDHVYRERYLPATPPYRLGDMVLIFQEGEENPVHACNVLAGNLVYTKNGQSMGRPWIISTIDELRRSYNQTGSVELEYARLKPEYRK